MPNAAPKGEKTVAIRVERPPVRPDVDPSTRVETYLCDTARISDPKARDPETQALIMMMALAGASGLGGVILRGQPATHVLRRGMVGEITAAENALIRHYPTSPDPTSPDPAPTGPAPAGPTSRDDDLPDSVPMLALIIDEATDTLSLKPLRNSRIAAREGSLAAARNRRTEGLTVSGLSGRFRFDFSWRARIVEAMRSDAIVASTLADRHPVVGASRDITRSSQALRALAGDVTPFAIGFIIGYGPCPAYSFPSQALDLAISRFTDRRRYGTRNAHWTARSLLSQGGSFVQTATSHGLLSPDHPVFPTAFEPSALALAMARAMEADAELSASFTMGRRAGAFFREISPWRLEPNPFPKPGEAFVRTRRARDEPAAKDGPANGGATDGGATDDDAEIITAMANTVLPASAFMGLIAARQDPMASLDSLPSPLAYLTAHQRVRAIRIDRALRRAMAEGAPQPTALTRIAIQSKGSLLG